MTHEQLQAYLQTNLASLPCMAIQQVAEFPGYVRSIYLQPGNNVRIEYEVDGLEEGGVYYVGSYPSLEATIEALERFLERSLAAWETLGTPDPIEHHPEQASPDDLQLGHAALQNAIRNQTVPLPEGTTFKLQGSSYWKQFEPR